MTWQIEKLGEVVELKYGKGISRDDRKPNGKYPVYGANGVLDHTDKFLVEGEAIIVGRKGSAGELTRVSGKFWPSDVTYYVQGNKQIDIDYLFHLLKSLDLHKFVGGIKPGLNRNRVYELEIPLPPIGEQRKIVTKLERVLEKIKEAKKLREEAESVAAALLPAELHKIFSEGKKKGWEEKELGDIIKMSSGDFLPSSQQIPGQHKVYGGNGVLGTHTKYNCENRSLIIGRVGAHCGVVHITEPNSWITDNALMVTEINKDADLNFLAIVLKNKRLNQYAKTSAQPSISQTTIKKLKIPLPPIAEQKKIVMRLDALSAKVQNIRQAQTQTASDFTALEQSVLHQVFNN